MSPGPREHLEIFNGGEEQARHQAGHQTFAVFPQLPEDLRLQIWRTSLQRERMIQICVHPVFQCAPGDSGGDFTPITTGYRTAVRGPRVLSRLLRVSREARRAALAFFRVRIPCTFRAVPPTNILDTASTMAPGHDTLLLLFNPEYDVLRLSISVWPFHPIGDDFLLDLPGLDPRGIGLRNLALDDNDFLLHNAAAREEREERSLSPPTAGAESARAAALRALVSGLHEVLFVTHMNLAGALVPAWPRGGDPSRQVEALLLNRAMPVLAHTTAFTRLPRDPRPLSAAADLGRVYVPEQLGLRGRARAARAALERLGALGAGDLPASVRTSWLLAVKPAGREVRDRETAEAFVQAEEAGWAGEEPWPSLAQELAELLDRLRPGDGSDDRVNDDDGGRDASGGARDARAKDLHGKAGVAFGYWSFPLNPILLDAPAAAEEAEEAEEEAGAWNFSHYWVTKSMYDFSKTWPELLLMELA